MELYLYHGTTEEGFAKIVLDGGIIKNNNSDSCCKDSETELLDELIKEHIGKDIRQGCIYLSDNYACSLPYDYAFTINGSMLDMEKLYISDNSILEKIRELYYSNANKHKIKSMVEKYHNTLMLYKDYIESELYYDNPEYLYFGEITVSIDDKDILESKRIKKELHLD